MADKYSNGVQCVSFLFANACKTPSDISGDDKFDASRSTVSPVWQDVDFSSLARCAMTF